MPAPARTRQNRVLVPSADIFETAAPAPVAAYHGSPSARRLSSHNGAGQEDPLPSGDRDRLATELRHVKGKYERAIEVQSKMEEEIQSRSTAMETLQAESRELKRQVHKSESELAQLTMEFINGQSKWLEEAAALNEEITNLKQQLKGHKSGSRQASAAGLPDTNPPVVVSALGVNASESALDKKTQQESVDLEKHQQELLIQELKNRHEQFKEELRQVKELNTQLQDENENFQVLVAGKAINGDFNTLEDELSALESPPPEDTEELAKELKKAKFENTALANHNKALRTSLERLINRLLDDKEFAQAVQETVPRENIVAFTQRVVSLNEQALRSQSAPAPPGGSPAVKVNWNKLIFNSAQGPRRDMSLGIDETLEDPPRFEIPQLMSRSVSTSSNLSKVSDMAAPPQDNDFLMLPKRTSRTTAQTSLRKLRLTD